jgi:hypothetical protein
MQPCVRTMGLFASFAILSLPCHPASAQNQTVTQFANFSTLPPPQSMWNGGVAPSYTTPFIGVNVPSPPLPLTISAGTPTIGGVSATASLSLNALQAGFTFGAAASGGTVVARYPITTTYNLPTQVNPGQMFAVSTSYVNGGNTAPLLLTTGASYSAAFNSTINVNATANFTLTNPISNLNTGPLTVLNYNQNNSVTVDAATPSLTLYKSNLVSASLQVPTQINTTSSAFSGPNTITSSGNSSPFLSGNLNLANMVAGALKVPPLNGSYSTTLSVGSSSNGASVTATLNYNLITADLQIGPSITQDFTLTADKFPITLVSSWGQVESGDVGDTFDFTAPQNGGPMSITTFTDIDNTFNNDTGLGLGTGFNYSLLGGSASLALNGYLVGYNLVNQTFNVGPLGPLDSETFNIPGLNTGNLLSIYNQSFPLAFNTPQQLLNLIVTPEPGGLTDGAIMFGLLLPCGAWLLRRRQSKFRRQTI